MALSTQQAAAAADALSELRGRYEQEAAALLRVTAGYELALHRLEQARAADGLAEVFRRLAGGEG